MSEQQCQSKTAKWSQLPSFPFIYPNNPLFINRNEFIIASASDGLHKFDVHQNEWIKVLNYDENTKYYCRSAAYDKNNRLLYVFEPFNTKILQFDLKINKLISSIKPAIGGMFSKLIHIQQKLHQICSSGSNEHHVYDQKLKEFKKIHQFESFRGLEGHGLIYLNSTKCILLFGGERRLRYFSDSIYSFSALENKWSALNIKMPIKLTRFGMIKTRNERYLVILGGITNPFVNTDDIFVYDTRKKTFNKSKIKCPAKDEFRAVISNDIDGDNILTFGFVNNCYKYPNFAHVQTLPLYLIELICRWVCNQEIYLLQGSTGDHWKINVDDILQSL